MAASLKMTLKEPPGSVTVTMTATFADGRTDSIDRSFTLVAPPASPQPPPQPQPASQGGAGPVAEPSAPAAWYQRLLAWALANLALAVVIGAAPHRGRGRGSRCSAVNSFSAPTPRGYSAGRGGAAFMVGSRCSTATPPATRCERPTLRIGRHRDNDICLQNDSISRRHALLHFNADNRRFGSRTWAATTVLSSTRSSSNRTS